jgi:hypothetical protein
MSYKAWASKNQQPDGALLPKRCRGRQSFDAESKYREQVATFCELIRKIQSTMDFAVGSRGWCYILERHGLRKGDFDDAQKLITECRKSGDLPSAQTIARARLSASSGFLVESWVDYLRNHAHERYTPISFWDELPVYVEVGTEKLDLRNLFEPVCEEVHVSITNFKGWSDLNSRAGVMRRFKMHEAQGRRCVLLLCGDHDPGGLHITEKMRKTWNSFSGDDLTQCRDHVRAKLGLPRLQSKEKKKSKSTAAKPWSPIVARYVYRQADGTPYQQVCRTAAKIFFQNRWNGTMWVSGKPEGPKVPYRLPELLSASLTTPIHIAEGEKDADNLAKLDFTSTTNSEGAANWSDDLNEYFRGRIVYIHEDNDEQGRKRCQRIARALDPIAKSVRIIRLPGLPPKGDISDWLASDPSGARLIKHCESTPVWEPSTGPPAEEDKEDTEDADSFVKKKYADILVELASSAELFHDQDAIGYARFSVSGHKENWPIRSKGFKRWLARGFYESTQSAPSSEAMSSALAVLEARAQFDAWEHDVRVRVAGRDGGIYIDLADQDWKAIEIDEDGWRVVDDPPVYFRRSAGMKPLPEPVSGGSLERDLRPLLNVKTDAEFVLSVAWLLAALRDSGPYPVLGLTGEQGSAKTFVAKILRAIIDPNSVPLRALPRNEHDVFIAARNSQVLAYDNVSGLPDWLSDTFCRLATGGGFSTRELYSDQDEVLFGSTRPILLNGIDDITTKPDLADRSILRMLAAISDEGRKLESELWKQFERKHPLILGALLTAVSHGLKTLPDVKLDRKPRMADFAVWAAACEGALWNKGAFMTAYTSNIAEAIELVLDADQVAIVLRAYMESRAQFEGSASELLQALSGIIPEGQQKAKGWPRRANTLSGILRRIAPPLRKIGIEISFERNKREKRIIIKQPEKLQKTASPSSPPSLPRSSNGLDETEDRHPTVTRSRETVTDDDRDDPDGDDPGDDPHHGIITVKPLKNKQGDDGDDPDDPLPTHAGARVNGKGKVDNNRSCRQCDGPIDGTEQLYQIDGQSRWLHPECASYLSRRKDQVP